MNEPNQAPKPRKSDLEALYLEREAIEKWLNPEPDPERVKWEPQAKARLAQIDASLASYFFPKPKDEGTQRKEKDGFAVMLKTGLSRKFDVPTIGPVIAECQKIADEEKLSLNVEEIAIDWKPSLNLTEFRALPVTIRKQLEHALIIEPTKPVFEIVKLEKED